MTDYLKMREEQVRLFAETQAPDIVEITRAQHLAVGDTSTLVGKIAEAIVSAYRIGMADASREIARRIRERGVL